MLLRIMLCLEGFILLGQSGFLMCSALQIALNWVTGRLSQPTWLASTMFLAGLCFVCLYPVS